MNVALDCQRSPAYIEGEATMIDEYLQPLTIMIVAMGCYLMIVPV